MIETVISLMYLLRFDLWANCNHLYNIKIVTYMTKCLLGFTHTKKNPDFDAEPQCKPLHIVHKSHCAQLGCSQESVQSMIQN